MNQWLNLMAKINKQQHIKPSIRSEAPDPTLKSSEPSWAKLPGLWRSRRNHTPPDLHTSTCAQHFSRARAAFKLAAGQLSRLIKSFLKKQSVFHSTDKILALTHVIKYRLIRKSLHWKFRHVFVKWLLGEAQGVFYYTVLGERCWEMQNPIRAASLPPCKCQLIPHCTLTVICSV